MKMLNKNPYYLLSTVVITAFLYSCGAPSPCDCKENDLQECQFDQGSLDGIKYLGPPRSPWDPEPRGGCG